MKTFLIVFLFSQFALASKDECALGILKYNEKYNPTGDIALHFPNGAAPSLFVRHPKDFKIGLEERAILNSISRACISSGMTNAVFQGHNGASVAHTICVMDDLINMTGRCEKNSEKMTIKRIDKDLK